MAAFRSGASPVTAAAVAPPRARPIDGGAGGWRRGALALLACLAACAADPDTPGGATAEEDRQLNEAAAMLDANSMGDDALPTDNGAAE